MPLPVEAVAQNQSPNQRLWPVTTRVNRRGRLEIGGCDALALATRFGTPLYVIDEATALAAASAYVDTLAREYPGEGLVIYASKAWNMLALCALFHQAGVGMDVVSGGELATALKAGVPPSRIYFHGNNKSAAELLAAIASGITLVVDNWLELNNLWREFQAVQPFSPDMRPRILLRLTPGIECHTHEYIRTGHLDSKFGFDPQEVDALFDWLVAHPQLDVVGLHAHIGSQIFELQPHRELAGVLLDFYIRGQARGLVLRELNIGGGLGICYTAQDDPPSIEAWVTTVAHAVKKACDDAGLAYPKLICEPGRSLIGPAGVTLYEIGAQKTVPGIRTYVSVDGGMSDNPRPITYGASYTALLANNPQAEATTRVTVAGKHCESGDILLPDVLLPPLNAGDILAVAATGAYNASMASNYNRFGRPAAVLVGNGKAEVVMKRESVADLMRQDRLPARLAAKK
jgi:diaminopimelate decarboxylase